MTNKAVRLRTVSTGGHDASVGYQVGTVTDGTFSPSGEEITVLYTEVRQTPLTIDEFISLSYESKWIIRAVEVPVSIPAISVTVNTVGATVTQWTYNTSVDYLITGPEIIPPDPPVPPGPGFPVVIQRNNSESICLTKSLTNILATQAVLRADTSLIDPVLLLEVDLATISLANYVTIPQFNRSYFITNIQSITTDLVELSCHVDVLSSFANEIKANTGIVRRQANDWNLYLNDDVIRCYQNPIVETRLFPHGFENSSYVLLLAGRRNVGVDTGQGGMISGDGIEIGGAGNVNSKTTSGLVRYAAAQVGKPYWYGTFGNEASADLLAIKRNQYSDMYDISVVGGTPFEDQYGQRVHDCVGLIKGYRWRENATGAEPVYSLAEDVNVQGLYAQCTRKKGTVGDPSGALVPVGAVLFYSNMQHCGVHIGAGSVIEARGHRYGVVITSLTTRPDFTLWGIPDWMQQV